jgi:membrane protease YdiL (CAAX protease family)
MSTYVPPRPDGPFLEDRPPVATWRAWQVLLITLLGFLGGSFLSAPVFFGLGGESGPMRGPGAASLVVTYLVLLVVLLLWLRTSHPGWSRVVGWPPPERRFRETAIGVGLGVAWQLVGVGIVALIVATVVEALTGESRVEVPRQVAADLLGWEIAALAIYAVIMAPIVEELVFRGLLYHAIGDRYGTWAGAFGSAIPFGLIHVISGTAAGVVVLVVTMIVTGLAWAWVHRWRRNLLVNIAMHAGFNLVGVLLTLEMIGA